jgi:hypothetical protein
VGTRHEHHTGRRDSERAAQQPDRRLVGAPVDRRSGHPHLQCQAVPSDQLRASGARLHVDVDDRAVAIGFDDALETTTTEATRTTGTA